MPHPRPYRPASSSGLKNLVVLALWAVCAAVAWRWASLELAGLRESADTRAAAQKADLTRLEAENRRLAEAAKGNPSPADQVPGEPAPGNPDSESTTKPRFDALRALAAKLAADPRFFYPAGQPLPAYAISSDGHFDSRFAELFGLEESAVATLEATTTALLKRLGEAEAERASARLTENGALVLDLQPVPDAAKYRDQFVAAMLQTLGSDRYATWTDLIGAIASGGPRELFDDFGGVPGTITITARSDGTYVAIRKMKTGNGSRPTAVRAGRIVAIDSDFGRGSAPVAGQPRAAPETAATLRAKDRDELAALLGPLSKLLPPGF